MRRPWGRDRTTRAWCAISTGVPVEAVVEERTQASLESYYRQYTAEELGTIRAIAMDMW